MQLNAQLYSGSRMSEVQKKIDPRRVAQLCYPTHAPDSNENRYSPKITIIRDNSCIVILDTIHNGAIRKTAAHGRR